MVAADVAELGNVPAAPRGARPEAERVRCELLPVPTGALAMNVARLLGSVAAVSLLGTREPPRFTPVQPDLLGAGSTLVNAWADYDGDGDLDLFVGFNGAPNRLYRNDNGRLLDVASAMGTADARATRAGAWG